MGEAGLRREKRRVHGRDEWGLCVARQEGEWYHGKVQIGSARWRGASGALGALARPGNRRVIAGGVGERSGMEPGQSGEGPFERERGGAAQRGAEAPAYGPAASPPQRPGPGGADWRMPDLDANGNVQDPAPRSPATRPFDSPYAAPPRGAERPPWEEESGYNPWEWESPLNRSYPGLSSEHLPATAKFHA